MESSEEAATRGRVLLLEPFGGMAGDMLLAALLDLGDPAFDLGTLQELVARLVPGECELVLEGVSRRGFAAQRLVVRTPESVDPPERHLTELEALVAHGLPAGLARERVLAALRALGAAEARVHGIPLERVHFHEVGAVDTLVDLAGACLALERLGVTRVYHTPPYVGGGTLRSAHGELPVPAPATDALLRGRKLVRGTGGERLTPTAAAFLASCAEPCPPELELEPLASGTGAGTRDPAEGPPNLLRVTLARAGMGLGRRLAWLVECNLDDATGEEIGFLVGELRRAGALEAWSRPVQMKKDRPGAIVSALAREEVRAELERILFTHSPTLGVRWTRAERTECARDALVVDWNGHAVRVKVRRRPGDRVLGELDVSPEYDDLAEAARATGTPLRSIEAEVRASVLGRGPR